MIYKLKCKNTSQNLKRFVIIIFVFDTSKFKVLLNINVKKSTGLDINNMDTTLKIDHFDHVFGLYYFLK